MAKTFGCLRSKTKTRNIVIESGAIYELEEEARNTGYAAGSDWEEKTGKETGGISVSNGIPNTFDNDEWN